MEDVDTFYDHLVHFTPLGMFYGHLVYFMVIWYIFPVLVCWTKKNLATLEQSLNKRTKKTFVGMTHSKENK
jgi:hypothetical protein